MYIVALQYVPRLFTATCSVPQSPAYIVQVCVCKAYNNVHVGMGRYLDTLTGLQVGPTQVMPYSIIY